MNLPPEDIESAHACIRELRSELARSRERVREARRETQCFRELAEHIREVFWMTNPLGDELVYISPAYEHIWGQTCDSLYASPGQRLAWIHDDDREHVLKAFKRDAARGEYDETYRIQRPDGEIRWIWDRAFPVYDGNGELYRLAGLALDRTNDIDAAERKAELHDLIAMRERISVFASLGTGLAHDLAQPLTAARNFLAPAIRLARQAGGDELDLLDCADDQIKRASSIVRHLREFAREGRPTIGLQSLYPMLGEVRELVKPALRAERVTCVWPLEADVGQTELPLDPVFVQQILRNLIGNAIQALAGSATAPHERRITLAVDCENHQHVDIRVLDNGDGIDENVDLFTPFATTKPDGLGLGLNVSRSLARSHGGDLFIVNRGTGEDELTCFVLRLPRHADTEQSRAAG